MEEMEGRRREHRLYLISCHNYVDFCDQMGSSEGYLSVFYDHVDKATGNRTGNIKKCPQLQVVRQIAS